MNAECVRYNELQGVSDGIVARTASALCAAAKAGDEALVLILARELFELEQQRLAAGTISEYFGRIEAGFRATLREQHAREKFV